MSQRSKLFNLIFILWLCAFVSSFWIDHIAINLIFIFTTIGFVAELVIEYRNCDNWRTFLKENYLEIIFLIPVFKVIRMGKMFKVGKAFRMLDIGGDLTEVIFRLIRRK